MNKVISKELFIEVLEDLKRAEKYSSDLNTFFKKHDVDGYIFQPDCSVSVILLLHEIFGDADKEDWISYFCYDLEFGKKWCPGVVKDEHGNDIPLSTPEELYAFLVNNG